jgi:excisionase family DNA binding protein
MKDWMTIKDLSEYLQIPESKIRLFIKHKQIPFHDNLGFLRFHREEVDEWMKTPTEEPIMNFTNHEDYFDYRGNPIKSFKLTASKIIQGKTPLLRLPGFIKETVKEVNSLKQRGIGRSFLYRKEFTHFVTNFDDYLRISCQLGLIENKKGVGKEKEYYPTKYAYSIYNAEEPGQIKKIIQDSIIDIVTRRMEAIPEEKHAIFLLWYILKIKERGDKPEDHHFQKDKDKKNGYFPSIRRSFAVSLCNFLFDNDRGQEQKFLDRWNQSI